METHKPASPARWFAVDDTGKSSVRVLSGLRIGETSDGELVINDPAPESQWLEFRLDENGALTVAVLADEWSLSIDGRKLVKQLQVLPGTCLVVGTNTLWIADEPAPPAATETRLRLVRQPASPPPPTPLDRAAAGEPATAERTPDPDITVRVVSRRPPRKTSQPPPDRPAASAPPPEREPDPDDTVRVTPQTPPRESRLSDKPLPDEPSPDQVPSDKVSPDKVSSDEPMADESGSQSPVLSELLSLPEPLPEPQLKREPRSEPEPKLEPEPKPEPGPKPEPLPAASLHDSVQWKFTVTDEVGVTPLDMPLRANRENRNAPVADGPRWGRRMILVLLAAVGAGAIWVAVERLARQPPVGGVAGGGSILWQPQPAEAPAEVVDEVPVRQPPQGPPDRGIRPDETAALKGPAEELAVPVVPPNPVPRVEPELEVAPAPESGPAALVSALPDAAGDPPPGSVTAADVEPVLEPAPRVPARPLSARGAELLRKARGLLDQGYITVPAGENAVSLLDAVLAESPRNAEALAMRAECAERLIEAALDARRYDLRFEARNTLEEVLAFDAGNQRASEIWQAWTREGW